MGGRVLRSENGGGTKVSKGTEKVIAAPKKLIPAESAGKIVASRLAARVQANAVEKKLTDSLGDLPEYNRVNMKEQAQLASDLIAADPDKAIRIARGEEEPPAHILPESVFVAVEEHAIQTGNVDLLRQLATGNLSSEATAMGQRIRALGERDQDSPVKAMRDVQQAREKAVEKRTGKTVAKAKKDAVSEMKKEIKKTASKRPDWNEFIKEITCNY
jgi:hypothetical protein